MRAEVVRVPVSRAVAVIGLFSAIYIFGGGLLGIVVGPFLRGYPAHFLRGWLMSAVAAYSKRMWSASLMGLISGLVFLVFVPAPAPYLPLATFAAGLAYDLSLRAGNSYGVAALSPRRIVFSTSVSSVGESVVALAILTYVGVIPSQQPLLTILWVVAIVANVALACVGSLITIWAIKRNILRSVGS